MAYVNRSYGNNYFDAEKEVVREEGSYGSYSSEYRVDECGNRVYPVGHRNHQNEVVAEVVTEVVPSHHHHYGGPTEIIERRDERIVDNAYDPYRRNY